MSVLLDFLKKNSYWFLFILLEVISATLIFRFNHYQGSVWFTQANQAAARINKVYSDINAFINLGKVNEHLTQQNSILQIQVNNLRELLKDKTKTLSLNERHILDTLNGYHIYNAKVVSSSLTKNNNHIIINLGYDDGIRQEMGVVGGGGIVGIVAMTGRHYSMVLPIINSKSRISCRIRRTGYYGSLVWEGGSVYYAKLMGVPQYAKVRKGDAIETSGYSTMFPPGLFVGKVTEIKSSYDGLSQELLVNLGTNFGNLRDVSVFRNRHKAEIQTLHNRLKAEEQEEK